MFFDEGVVVEDLTAVCREWNCDMAVSMQKDLEDTNKSVETIIMDGDTTTKAKARKEI